MRTKDYEESKRELENRKKQNDKKILINDERTRMSKVNQFEFKALKTLFLSFMGYLVLLGIGIFS